MERLELFCTVTAPFEVRPEVAVINPEIVGVAVQAVPDTVRFPPKEVRFAPDTVKVLSKVAAPWRVSAPGVVALPMVFALEAPLPKVFTVLAPVARVALPLEERVVKAPVPAEVAPIEVKFPAAGVVTPMVVPLIVPPATATEEEPKLLAVTNPVPNVTGLFVVVFIPKAALAPEASMTGAAPLKVRFPPKVGDVSNTRFPVPVVPVTED